MVSDLRAPGVLIERFTVDRPADPARIDVAAFVIVAERGPLDAPQRVTSWPDFVMRFGGFVHGAFGAYAVKAYFDNGADACWVVRVATPSVSTTTVGAQPAHRRASIVADLDRLVVGAAATLSQGVLDRTYLVTGIDAPTSAVTWDRALHHDFDLTFPIGVSTGANAASTSVEGPSGPCLRLVAASPGVWGNHLTITSGPGRVAATTNVVTEPSDGSFTVVHSAVGFEPGTTVVVSQDIAGVVSTAERVVSAWDPASGLLRWDSSLPAAFDVTASLTVRSHSFSLTVAERGTVREIFTDLQAVVGGSRYVVDALSNSRFVHAEAPTGRVPVIQSVRPRQGRDGLAALRVDDMLGDDLLAAAGGSAAAGIHGLATTVDLDEPAAVVIADLVAPSAPGVLEDPPDLEADPCWPCQPDAPPPPLDDVEVFEGRNGFDDATVLAAQKAVIEHCERNGERMALLDPSTSQTSESHPPASSSVGTPSVSDVSRIVLQLVSDRAVLVVPWIAVVDPAVGSARAPSLLPASGHYAGLIARTDINVGPWAAPANQPLVWAHGLGAVYDDDQHGLLNEAGAVVIRSVAALGLMPLGVRTLSSDPLWVFVTVRRTMMWLRRTIRAALTWTAFEPNDHTLARSVTTTLEGLLYDVWSAGGLAGDDPSESFFVHAADARTNPAGHFVCTVGVALARPAEFITVQVHRTDNRLELIEVPQPGSWP